MMKYIKRIVSCAAVVLISFAVSAPAFAQEPGAPSASGALSHPPPAPAPASVPSYPSSYAQGEEFRGVWVASVANTNWPSKKGLSEQEQKNEFIHLADEAKAMNLNAMIVQIRPTADAFYPSELNPWSSYLSGKQGEDPGYDPLEFMIEESHKRGMEFHAWFNPFRVSTTSAVLDWDEKSVMIEHPSWVVWYDNMRWLNPGLPEVRDYAVASVMEVVRGYDIDAVHFDDYFYPYPSGGKFPDKQTYNKYQDGVSDIYDWRRSNIDSFIKSVHDSIKAVKPEVKFGVSPIGVWRSKTDDPEGSNTTAKGSYDTIYADTRLWVRKSWVDYVAPQIYWEIGYSTAAYEKVLDFWVSELSANPNVHLYIGLGVYRVGARGAWSNPNEIPNQLDLNRKSGVVKGVVFYNINSLIANPLSIRNVIRNDFYQQAAAIPNMPWLRPMSEAVAQAE
ncbi:MAG: family 10 glycosylhydrolase [Clostridiales bacterium]|jgi:uncharacterized lipoprotein YddW (UPF0748 family)|nr:family 10 glycosylhydrolase [Clostridiales bacterium]